MLQNAYFLAKFGADTAENEQHLAEILPIGRRVRSPRRRTACRLAAVFSLTFPVFASINTLTLLASGETYLGMLEWTQNSSYVVFAGGKMTREFRRQ